MRLIATALLVTAGSIALSGCPAKEAKDGLETVEQATSVQCVTERDMLAQQVEAYTILEGKVPVTEAEMVPNYLRTESIFFDLDASGNIVAAPGSGCA